MYDEYTGLQLTKHRRMEGRGCLLRNAGPGPKAARLSGAAAAALSALRRPTPPPDANRRSSRKGHGAVSAGAD